MRISMEFMVEAKQLSAPAAEFHVQQEREPSRLQQRGEGKPSRKNCRLLLSRSRLFKV